MQKYLRFILFAFISSTVLTHLAYAIPTRLDFTATLTAGSLSDIPSTPNFTGFVIYDSSSTPTSSIGPSTYLNLTPSSATYQGNIFSINGFLGGTHYSFSSDECQASIKNDTPYFGSSFGLDEMVVSGVDNFTNTTMIMHFNELGHPANLFTDASLPTILNIPSYLSDTDSLWDVVVGSLRGNINSVKVSEIAAVPEPATLILLAAGVAGLAFWRRRTDM